MFFSTSPDFVCGDYSLKLVDAARKDGYIMWLQIVVHPFYAKVGNDKIRMTNPGEGHALVSTLIGEDGIYFIEPQSVYKTSMDELWLWLECRLERPKE